MKVIGLTGGIGSGKSTVASFLSKLGAVVVDADKIGHEVLENDSQVRQQISQTLGHAVFTTTGRVDRKKLGDLVFNNDKTRTQLNSIIHPPILCIIQTHLEQYRRQGVKVVVIDAPLLLEADWDSQVDEVWVSISPRAIIIERLKRKGFSCQDALARIRFQMTDSQRRKMADVVIHNNSRLDKLELKVERLWRRRQFDTCK
ncbi:dephospho-CoA kinase [Chloroflexota bacterium]